MAAIKQDWTKDRLSFRCHAKEIRGNNTTSPRPPQALTPIYGEPVNLVEGLTEEEVTTYQEANPDFVPLFKIEVLELPSSPPQPTLQVKPPKGTESLSRDAVAELKMAITAIRAELAKSRRIQATELEELNLRTPKAPHKILIASQLPLPFWQELVTLLKSFRNVLAWAHIGLRGLDVWLYRTKSI